MPVFAVRIQVERIAVGYVVAPDKLIAEQMAMFWDNITQEETESESINSATVIKQVE